MPEIYLDNSATTKPYDEVINELNDIVKNDYGNPSSLYRLGRNSKAIINNSREIIANSLGVNSEEIYFTSGGTEANNLAIMGVCEANEHVGKRIVTSVAEHPSVTKAIRILRRQGWDVQYIPIKNDQLDFEQIEQAINDETVLVSIMVVNNETGSIFQVDKVKEIIKEKQSPALLHCDAVQAYGKLKFTAESLGADLLSLSAHKIHGIKGCGALYVKKGTNIYARMFGGNQEQGLRSGTESTPLIGSFGLAAKITDDNLSENIAKMTELKEYCIKSLQTNLPEAVINTPENSAPHIVNFSIPHYKNSDVVQYLDEKEIYIGSGAACKSNHSRGPSMLESLGLSRELANSALRISFSHFNKKSEIDKLVTSLAQLLKSGQLNKKSQSE